MTKIVIVDDVVSNALLIKGYLKSLAVDAVIFTDPRDALAWCHVHEPDLVLLDYKMPEMNGTEFLVRFRGNDRLRDIPVVVVTWDESKDTLYQALKSGATDFLRKPIDRVELIVRTQNMLELRSRQRELAEARSLAVADASHALPVIDNAQLSQLRAQIGDTMVRALLQSVPDEASKSLMALRKAIAANDLADMRRIGHDMQGYAGNFGVARLAVLAGELLREDVNMESVRDLFSRLESVVEQSTVKIRSIA